jgi:hypothetical protein
MPMTNTEERSPEAELLICCARTHIDDETAARIRDLANAPLDWTSLLQLADEHMVLPLLYHALDEVAPDAAPSAAQDQLRTGFHANVRNNLLLAHELLDLLALFDEHDIPVVPFKGPVAATSVYDDLHLRPFGDLDLLVHLQDVPRAQRLLLDRGFEDWETLPPLSALDFDRPPSWYSALTEPFSKAKTYVRASEQDDKIPIELHWELMAPYFRHPLDPEPFWERLRTVTLLDTSVPTFSPEDTLFYFCLHGTVHRWSRLRLVCDVAEFLQRHSALEWAELLDRAERLHSERLFLLGLRLAHELLEAPLPAPVRRRVYDHAAVASLAQTRNRRLFHRPQGASQIWSACAYDLQIRDRLRDGLGLCIRHTYIASLAFPAPLRKWWD